MVNQPELQGRWHEIKGKLKAKWGQLSEDDLQSFSGNTEQLVGVIQRKTGEMRENIERSLQEIAERSGPTMERASKAVQDYSHRAGEAIHENYDHMAQAVREGYHKAEGMVRNRPAESVAVIFALGLIAGAVFTLAMRSR